MPEYFDKYDDFPTSQTNRSIDEPVIYQWRMTMPELGIGMGFLFAGLYVIGLGIGSYLWTPGLALLYLSYIVPKTLRNYRENYPPNSLIHRLWLWGVLKKGDLLSAPKKGVYGP